MHSFTFSSLREFIKPAAAAIVLATVIHTGTEAVQADSVIRKRPDNTGFQFQLNESANVADERFLTGIRNSYYLLDSGIDTPSDCPSDTTFGTCIPFQSGDLEITEGIFALSGVFSPSSAGMQYNGVQYTTTLFPKNPNAAITLNEFLNPAGVSYPVQSIKVKLILIKPSKDFTSVLPSFSDLQNTFDGGGELQVSYDLESTLDSTGFSSAYSNPRTLYFNKGTLEDPSYELSNTPVANSSAEPVPEPLTGSILGSAAIGAGLILKRRRAKRSAEQSTTASEGMR